MSKITPFDYQGQAVAFNAEGWINATDAAARFGKRPVDWLALDGTKDYLAVLSGILKCEPGSLLKTKRGNSGGTWLHPKLAVRFAQWLDMTFAVWCDLQIDGLLRGESKPWVGARREAAIGYRALCDALAINCEAQGKTPKPHIFINEARLINEVVAGAFTGRNRDQLSSGELELVTLAELRDTALIGRGLSFAERKFNLLAYVRALQTKHLGGKAA